jgi:pyruvate-formate lyase-activating enzyme
MDAVGAPGPTSTTSAAVAEGWPWRVFVGARCNNGCRACPLEERAVEAEDVGPALAAGRAAGCERVIFVGGEPTVHDGLTEWIGAAADAGYRAVGLQTNGRRLAYPRYARKLVDAGLQTADVSLHGPRAAIHDHHTRAPDSFRQTIAGLGAARAAGLAVGVTSVVTRSNHRHLVELVQLVATLRVDALHLTVARPVGGAAARFDAVVPRLALVAPHLRAAAEAARRLRVLLVVSGMPACLRDGVMGPWLGAPAGAFGPACADCAARSGCEGFPRAYADRFGFDEARPPTDVLPSEDVTDPRLWRFAGLWEGRLDPGSA